MEAVVEPVVALNRYANGRIYKICSDLTEQVYIGSTCNPLSKRMAEHRAHHRMFLAGRYNRVTSFDILQHEDAKIILIENFPCDSKEQLIARERHWIQTTPNCVNKMVPGRTRAEWHRDNRDRNLEQMAEYHVTNRDRILEQRAEYRAANRDVINEKANQKHDCECGGKFTASNRTAHLKTKKHQDWLKNEPAAAPPAAEVEA